MGVLVQEDQKIGLISLAQAVEEKQITMSQAYKTAVSKLGFRGNIGDFMDVLKGEGLVTSDDQQKIDSDKKKAELRKKIIVTSLVGVGLFLTIKLLTKKD